ncbi:MAG TPA: aspartate-semialdehyde dehydrogenase [Polyangiaceae bacterium]|nr:aspartate-semialdehyde dehydrogenase [Polyangiaceae bacterium]
MARARIRCAVLGATGVAGQQFLVALDGHPDFELVKVAASERSAGKRYGDAIRDAGHEKWYCREPLPAAFAALPVEDASTMSADGLDLVFAAVESDAARVLEPRFAEKVPVLSTASAFRYEHDVPILIPGVNGDHAKLIDAQKKRRNWRGFIVPGPNCTTTGMAITLKPLADAFGLEKVVMTSLQATSGAGRSPGVAALDILDNVIPYISKEEEKVERETRKILGRLDGSEGIVPADVSVSCTCTRVPVLDGHTECVFVALKSRASVDDARRALREFAPFGDQRFPSAPARMIEVLDDPYRPQPRLDRDAGGGMTTVVGRLREESTLGGASGVKYVLVSHNTRMGAAKGMVLLAEWLRDAGHLG